MRGVERAQSASDEAAGAGGRPVPVAGGCPVPAAPQAQPRELPALLSRGQWMHTHLPAHLPTPPWAPTPAPCPGHGHGSAEQLPVLPMMPAG